ncbi:WecB/TagA/CpsF family glycosyltransferase [Litoreibacter meonggei]|uniref:WecB/TagA/CpsF family glycosyltransferase n=1 Tax=Litoreibacter meonggei TaxID=1049199 RepID=UPI001FE324D9|nr:WecB/TagA/CpsF family glycosyltransferase [Litoreibacter meonggei]
MATLNLDHVVKMRALPDFHEAYANHSHITADGNPIVWLSRLSGHQIDLVPGSELIDPICDMAASLDAPVAFLGSTEASLAEAARVLKGRYPGLTVATCISPPMGFDATGPMADACIEQLAASGARICFLALGAPKQELFASYAAPKLPQIGFLSIGAGPDFVSGVQTRAPKIVRKLAAEWLWRLATNPARFAGRYGKCIALLPGLLRDALRARAVGNKRGQ